jgi:integrase
MTSTRPPSPLIDLRRLCGQTIRDVLAERSKHAAVRDATPHDSRRTVIGDLLDLGVDVVLVSQPVGHADPKQTGGYDRRPQRAQRDAVDRLHLPQPGEPAPGP